MSGYQFDDDARPIFSRGPLLVLKLALITLIAGGLMFYDHRADTLAPVRDGLAVGLEPVQWISQLPTRLSGVAPYLQARAELVAHNDQLQHEHLRLNARLQRLMVLEQENQRMQALLDASRPLHNAVMIGEILSASLDPYQQRVRINRGKNDGAYEGQALIDAHGIMGQIISVTPYSSTGVLITDPSQGVPVQINRNGLRTVAHGTGSDRLQLPFLPSNSDIQVGDLLVSSGLGGRYPAGYPVAIVEHIEVQPGEHFLNVMAVPVAQLQHGRDILLVREGVADVETADIADPTATPGRIASADQ